MRALPPLPEIPGKILSIDARRGAARAEETASEAENRQGREVARPLSQPSEVPALRQELARLLAETENFVEAARARNTLKAYESDWADFAGWAAAHGFAALPATPETVALYLTALARSKKPSTLSRRLAAISQTHQGAGFASPTAARPVKLLMAGIQRQKGTAAHRKKPLLAAAVAAGVATLPETLVGLRNRALLLVGFAGALRRSELVALVWEDLETTAEGLRLWVSRSKTDPAGKGRAVGIPYGAREESCPVRALAAWREKSELSSGPVFPLIGRTGKIQPSALSPRAVARLVKLVAGRLGLNPEEFSAHSLRAGLATSAAAGGASERAIMNQTGHRSVKTVRGYIREGSLFRDNAVAWSGI